MRSLRSYHLGCIRRRHFERSAQRVKVGTLQYFLALFGLAHGKRTVPRRVQQKRQPSSSRLEKTAFRFRPRQESFLFREKESNPLRDGAG